MVQWLVMQFTPEAPWRGFFKLKKAAYGRVTRMRTFQHFICQMIFFPLPLKHEQINYLKNTHSLYMALSAIILSIQGLL